MKFKCNKIINDIVNDKQLIKDWKTNGKSISILISLILMKLFSSPKMNIEFRFLYYKWKIDKHITFKKSRIMI